MKISVDDRRAQLLACANAVAPLATRRAITAVHVSKIEADHEVRRVLETIVRRWTKGIVPSYTSDASADAPKSAVDLDHIVPCRVLVDRMIMAPGESGGVLEAGIVLARITKAEHARLGGIYQDHQPIYEQMLSAPLDELLGLGLERYRRSGIDLRPLQ